MTAAIWWMRRDLRLTDNHALAVARQSAAQVLPVFILDDTLLASQYVGSKRLAFLLEGLRRLDADLHTRGSRLIVRQGQPVEVLAALLRETHAEAIFAEEDFSPYARRRDARVKVDLPLTLIGGPTVQHPSAVLKPDGRPYTVFTPFSRAWLSASLSRPEPIVAAPDRLDTPGGIDSMPIPIEPALSAAVPFVPGEAEAQRRLLRFVEGDAAPIFAYAEMRDRPDLDATSQLSPYLRFGMISARQAVAAAIEAARRAPDGGSRQGAEAWLGELIWREFFVMILHHFPQVRRESFRADLRGVRWLNDAAQYAAWCEGRTGYPIVDAAMRQLSQTGWMHNRARMIVASFLTKDLLVDWRWGERWFMQYLVDGDPAANNGGWQWTAGTGTDAAAYFRVFNPTLQAQKFDPGGAYVRRWLPELARVPDRFVHRPWAMSPAAQQQAGCVLGRDYPEPIIDHAAARERALAAYSQARGNNVCPK